MDKTTLAAELDRLESAGLVSRRVDPRDRRARVPVITRRGDAVRARIADRAATAESAAVHALGPRQVALLCRALCDIIGDGDDLGTCV